MKIIRGYFITVISVILLLFIMILFSTPSFASISNENNNSVNTGWKNNYKSFLKSPKNNIAKLVDDSYYRMYFGSDYKLNRYMLYDSNKDGIPELFLFIDSSYYGPYKNGTLGYILTYRNNKIVCLDFTSIIGVKNHYILEEGHWHGAGDAQPEWTGLRIHSSTSKDLADGFHMARLTPGKNRFYMMKMVWNNNNIEKQTYNKHISKSRYKKMYNKYVKGYTSLYKYFKNGSSVKDTSLIDSYN